MCSGCEGGEGILCSVFLLLVQQIFGGATVDTSRSHTQWSIGCSEEWGREADNKQTKQ